MPHLDENSRPTELPDNNRRRILLRGSLSVPVVLTISPGGAAAAVSAVNCVTTTSTQAPPGELEASTSLSANYYRTKVTAMKAKDYDGTWYAITTPDRRDYLIQSTTGDVRKVSTPIDSSRLWSNDTIERYVVKLYNSDGTVKGAPASVEGFPQVVGNEAGWASLLCLASFPSATG